jgi:hypothetical protein
MQLIKGLYQQAFFIISVFSPQQAENIGRSGPAGPRILPLVFAVKPKNGFVD